jgi:hypothetical protein
MEKRANRVESIIRVAGVIAVACIGVLTIIASVHNAAPFALTVAWTGPSRHVQTGSTVTMDGRGSDLVESDQVGVSDRISYRWKFISKPEGSTADWGGPIIVTGLMPSFVADKDGEYVIQLDTVLGSEPESTDTIRVVASSGNSAPVAEAGPHQEVKPGTLVTLDGTSSSDADGDSLKYIWSFDADSPKAILSDDESPTPSFMPEEGEYRLKLEVDDGTVRSREDFVTVRASAGNSRPIAIAGSDQIVAPGTPITLDASDSRDVDGDELTYSWRILSSSIFGAAITDPDSENTTLHMDSQGICVVQLRVNDGKDRNLRLRDDTNLDRLVIHAVNGSGGGAVALTLQTSLPYTPADMEVAIQIQIDADGADTVRVISSSSPDASTSSTVLQGHLNDPLEGDEAYFYTVNADWSVTSRTHDNPVDENDSPTFIVQRVSDSTYYRIDIEFTGSPATASLTVDNLSAWRCGSDQGDCP